MTWDIFKENFLDLFFPTEMREEIVTVFINLRKEEKIVHEYSIEFIKLSKYAPSLVSYPRDQMSLFLMGVSENLQEEC